MFQLKDVIEIVKNDIFPKDLGELTGEYSIDEINEAIALRPIPGEIIEIYSTPGSLKLIDEYVQLFSIWALVDSYTIDAIIDLKNSTIDYLVENHYNGSKEAYAQYLSSNSIYDWEIEKPDTPNISLPFIQTRSARLTEAECCKLRRRSS